MNDKKVFASVRFVRSTHSQFAKLRYKREKLLLIGCGIRMHFIPRMSFISPAERSGASSIK